MASNEIGLHLDTPRCHLQIVEVRPRAAAVAMTTVKLQNFARRISKVWQRAQEKVT